MSAVRLVADDLTGALDTVAKLVPLAGPMPVFWPDILPSRLPAACALDSGAHEAAARIATAFLSLIDGVMPPDTRLVAGGETLRGLCAALGTTSLEVRDQFEPGLPHSIVHGGCWDGVTVVSKSGALGGPSLWRDLLAAFGHRATSRSGRVGTRPHEVLA